VREIVTIGCQVLTGLHNIHSKGLIHFDIKPDNILLSNRGEALLSDFGLAKQMALGVAIPNQAYTPMVPPELWAQQGFGPTFDIYQFGLTLYRMCNGNEAFYAQLEAYGAPPTFDAARFSADVIAGRFPDRNAFPPHIPAKLRNVIKKCLRVDPSQRYQYALEVSNALAQVDGETLDWRFTSTPDRLTWTKNKNGTLTTLVVERNGPSTCTKQVGDGAPRRVKAMCKPAVNLREVARFLGEN
jgi:serine/threonine protein kinase